MLSVCYACCAVRVVPIEGQCSLVQGAGACSAFETFLSTFFVDCELSQIQRPSKLLIPDHKIHHKTAYAETFQLPPNSPPD